MRRLTVLPICIGTYDAGEPVCDGVAELIGEAHRQCPAKHPCRKLTEHVESTGEDLSQFTHIVKASPSFTVRGIDKVAKPVGMTVEEFATRWGGADYARSLNWAKARESSTESIRRRHRQKRNALIRECLTVVKYAQKRFHRIGLKIHIRPRQIIWPGEFYVVHRAEYTSVVERRSPYDTGLLRFKHMTGYLRLNVSVAAPLATFREACTPEEISLLSPVPYNSGAFQMVCRAADTPRAKTVVDIVAKLIKQGKLNVGR